MSESAAAPADTGTPSDTAPNDDALVPPDPADIEEANEGQFEDDEPLAEEPEPRKPAQQSRPAPAKKPEPKKAPPPAKKAAANGEEPPEEEAPPEEEFEYEFEDKDDKGNPVKRKEKLTKGKVAEILARRRRLDAEAFARITEANKLRGPVEDLFKQVKSNPMAIYDIARMAGVDPHQAAAQYAAEWKRQQELTPEQREFEQREDDLKRQKDDLDRKQADMDKAAAEKELHGKRQKILSSVTAALEAAKMPRHPTVLQLVGDHLAAQVRGQPKDFEPDFALAVEAAQDGLRDASTARLNALAYEQLIEEFPDVVKKIREGDKARVKGAPGNPGKRPPPPPPAAKNEEPKFLSPQAWGERMRSGG